MNAETLLKHLNTIGITLTSREGNLIYRAPKGVMTDDLKTTIKQYKPQLLELLSPLSRMEREQKRLEKQVKDLAEWLYQHTEDPDSAAVNIEWEYLRENAERDANILKALQEHGFVPLHSGVLGETVIFVVDEDVKLAAKWKNAVTYTLDEFDFLRTLDVDTLRVSHRVKKLGGGTVMPDDGRRTQ